MTADPRTVTFGSESQDEIQYRAARRVEAWLGLCLGVATLIAWVVAEWHALLFSTSLAAGWSETIRFGLVATALTLALTGLPIGAATMASSYPREARNVMRVWFAAIAVAVISMGVSVSQIDPQEQAKVAPDEETIRVQANVDKVVWRYSNHCRHPENEGQAADCDRFRAGLAAAQPSDWSPRTLFSIATTVPDGPYRRVTVAAFGILAILCAGLLGRWYVLSASQSHRVSYGEPAPLPSGGFPALAEGSAGMGDGASALTPADIFSLWANSRLMPTPGKSVQGQMAFDDYADTCRLNGIEPMTLTKFGILMTGRAEGSQGRVIKSKIGGKMVYQGWQLASELQTIGGSAPVAQIGRVR